MSNQSCYDNKKFIASMTHDICTIQSRMWKAKTPADLSACECDLIVCLTRLKIQDMFECDGCSVCRSDTILSDKEITCTCGGTYFEDIKDIHFLSDQHQSYLCSDDFKISYKPINLTCPFKNCDCEQN